MQLSDDGIVLRLSEFSESSQIATLLTAEHGLVRLIAKGVRRGTRTRFAAGLDLLERGQVVFVPPRADAGLGTLTDWRQLDGHSGLRSALPALYGALYAAELSGALVEEHDPHPALYSALADLLRTLSGSERDARDAAGAARAVAAFQAVLLTEIGYAPNLSQCVDCGVSRDVARAPCFSATAGGLLCRDCEMHHVEKRALPAGLAAAADNPARAAAWLDLQHYMLRHIAGREFQTADPALRALLAPRRTPPRR